MKAGKTLTKTEKMKREIMIRQLLRFTVQLFFFFLMPGAFVAGFAGVKYLFSCLNQGKVIELNGFLQSLLGLATFTIIFGRFFCGYICAFGTTGDLIHGLSVFVQTRIFKKKKTLRIPDSVAVLLQKLKYLNLFSIVALCTFGFYTRLSGTSIWDVFSRLVRGQAVPAGYGVGVFLLVLVVLGMAVEERFFCQFLCPMGALFALLPVFPFSSLVRKETNCAKNCRICLNSCPSHIKISNDEKRIGECISCGKCQGACPKGNLSTGIQKVYRREVVGVLIKSALFFALGIALGF